MDIEQTVVYDNYKVCGIHFWYLMVNYLLLLICCYLMVDDDDWLLESVNYLGCCLSYESVSASPLLKFVLHFFVFSNVNFDNCVRQFC